MGCQSRIVVVDVYIVEVSISTAGRCSCLCNTRSGLLPGEATTSIDGHVGQTETVSCTDDTVNGCIGEVDVLNPYC